MLKAYKGNRSIRIEDHRRAAYEAMGYTIKSMDGKVISAPVDKDAEIKKLKEEVARLQKELEKAKGEADFSKYMNSPLPEENGHEDSPAESETEPAEEKPAKKRRARKTQA